MGDSLSYTRIHTWLGRYPCVPLPALAVWLSSFETLESQTPPPLLPLLPLPYIPLRSLAERRVQ